MSQQLRIATRKSPLAIWQAEHVANLLSTAHPEVVCELVPLSTSGDEIKDIALTAEGGKGLFLKELETALLEGEADLAVHSMKDVPIHIDPRFRLTTIGRRAAPEDVLVSSCSMKNLSKDAIFGTTSVRRKALLSYLYKQTNVVAVRGNVQTRLSKLDRGEVDALILAKAGLERLGLTDRIQSVLPVSSFIPAVAQGVLAVEYLYVREDLGLLLESLVDQDVEMSCQAERHVAQELEADCALPIGVHCQREGDHFDIQAIVLDESGSHILQVQCQDSDPAKVAAVAAKRLVDSGARELLGKG